MPDYFKNPKLGIATPATPGLKPAPPPAPAVFKPPPGYPWPIPNPNPPLPKPTSPGPRPSPLPPSQLKPPFNVKGKLEPALIPIFQSGEWATLTWDAPAIQPTSTTYEIYLERDNLTRLPEWPFATEPELCQIVIHTQGQTKYSAFVPTSLKNAKLRVGETARFYIVARCDNGTLNPVYAPGLFGIKIYLPRRV